MRFIQTHSMGSDCTAPYDIVDYQAKTAVEFINEMLQQCKSEWCECYEPMRGSLEELQMAIDSWKKIMALYEAKLLNRHDGIFVDVALDIGKGEDKSVISIYDKLHKTIDSRIIRTDNPDAQSWLKSFMQIDKDGKETETKILR